MADVAGRSADVLVRFADTHSKSTRDDAEVTTRARTEERIALIVLLAMACGIPLVSWRRSDHRS
jgi:hypothetical protein